MNNFTYCNPTELVFGKDSHLQTGSLIVRALPQVKKLMVVYGGGSAVRSGVLASVVESCEKAGLLVVVKGGVRPNPTVDFVRECIDFARAEKVDMFLAVGGGSVIDTAKAAALGVCYEGDVWDFFCGKAQPQQALPVCTVLTIPAAGSEQSIRTVISNGNVKAGAGNALVRPKLSIVNPELFFTLPQRQVSAGIIDMMSHIMERYFTNTPGVDYTSAQAEAALRVIMRNGLKLMQKIDDYEAWCEVGLAGSFAHNGYFGLGHEEDWACHGIEHALSGWDDRIVHGEGLAVVIPSWMSYVWPVNPARFVRFAREVFGVSGDQDDETTIKLAIAKFCSFLIQMNLPTKLSQLTEREVPIKEIAQASVGGATLGHFKALNAQDVEAILVNAR